eukprot:jgi/Antlo1/1118/221
MFGNGVRVAFCAGMIVQMSMVAERAWAGRSEDGHQEADAKTEFERIVEKCGTSSSAREGELSSETMSQNWCTGGQERSRRRGRSTCTAGQTRI